MVQYLAGKLRQWGRTPGIILRGYGGSTMGPHSVASTDPVELVGDEALMHFQLSGGSVPVIVARHRLAGAQLAAERCDTILLDDGFQHFALTRDLDVLVFDVSSPAAIEKWSAGVLLPGGWLREPIGQALQRAGAVMLLRKSADADGGEELFKKAEARLKELGSRAAIFRLQMAPSCLLDPLSGKREPLEELRGRQVIAVSALGDPESFEDSLAELGAVIAERFRFSDHHQYSGRELAQALRENTMTVTTAKDIVKLRSFLGDGLDRFAKGAELRVLCTEIAPLTQADEIRLRELILGKGTAS